MNIFNKRPLSLILCITLGAFVFSSFYDDVFSRTALIFVAIIAFSLSFLKNIRKHASPVLIRIIAVCSIIATLFSFIYFDLWFKAYDRFEGDVKIVGKIEEIEYKSQRSSVLVKTSEIENASLSRYKLIVYLDNEEYYGYSIGSSVEIVGTITSFTSDEDFDSETFYNAKGVSGYINDVQTFKITDVGEYTLSYKITDLRESVCRRIISSSNADTGGLLCAFLLGERSYLPTGTTLDFLRTGLTHMLALSGMNLVILFAGFKKFLLFCRVGKKPTTFLTIIFTLFYIVLTGLPMSVVRAGFMLIISSALFLFQKSYDSMTALFVSVAVICIIEPYAIYDLSLWLSALATLGIVVFVEFTAENAKKPSFLKMIAIALLASLFAIASTFAITVIKFDGTSILSPLTTLIVSVLGEIFTYLGIVLFIVGDFILIRHPFIFVGNLIISIAKLFSKIDLIYVSTNFVAVEILALIFTTLFFAFFILKIKRKKLAVGILLSLLGSILCLSAVLTYSTVAKDSITYYNNADERIIVVEDGDVTTIDIATYSKNTAYSLYADLSGNNLTKIDKYVLTHYSYYLREAIETVSNSILIREILIPAPVNITEERILREISTFAQDANIRLSIYLNEDKIILGNTSIIPIYRYELGSQKKNMLSIIRDDKIYTYLSDDMLKGETKTMASEIIAGSHTIILGRHKSGNSKSEFIESFESIEKIILSTEELNINEDTYKYYVDKGTEIFFASKKKALYVE